MTPTIKRFCFIVLLVALILCIPLVAMQLTNEVVWTLPDFLIMGILLLGTGLLFELTLRKVKKDYRFGIIAVILLALLLIWVELAVGIFGTPFAGS